jgi:hypothetical protein
MAQEQVVAFNGSTGVSPYRASDILIPWNWNDTLIGEDSAFGLVKGTSAEPHGVQRRDVQEHTRPACRFCGPISLARFALPDG